MKKIKKKNFIGVKEDVFSWGKGARNPNEICMYCGRPGSANPSDYGLHYNDKDVFGRKYVCPLCDIMITYSNRLFKCMLEELEDNNVENAKQYLDQAINNLLTVRDSL